METSYLKLGYQYLPSDTSQAELWENSLFPAAFVTMDSFFI